MAVIAVAFAIGTRLLLRYMGVDDPADVVACHLTGGLWGAVAFGLFASQERIASTMGAPGMGGLLFGVCISLNLFIFSL